MTLEQFSHNFPSNWFFSRDVRYLPLMSYEEKQMQEKILKTDAHRGYSYEIITGIADEDNIDRLVIFDQWLKDSKECFERNLSVPLMPPIPNGKWGKIPRHEEKETKMKALGQWQTRKHSAFEQLNVPYETVLSCRPRKTQVVVEHIRKRNTVHHYVKQESLDKQEVIIIAVAAHILGWRVEEIHIKDVQSVIDSKWKNTIIKYYETDFPNAAKDELFVQCKIFSLFQKLTVNNG